MPKEKAPKLKCEQSHEGEALTRDVFVQRMQEWISSLRPIPTSVRVKRNDWKRTGYYYRFLCKSCSRCPWKGFGAYDRVAKKLYFEADPVEKHSGKERKWGSKGLTQVCKDVIRQFLATCKDARLQQIMQVGDHSVSQALAVVCKDLSS